MNRFANVLQMLIRLLFVLQLLLGLCFWFGKALGLVPLHMGLGMVFVLLLWILAIVGFMARVGPALPVLLLVWGLVVAWLGMVQRTLLVGDQHWVIRVAHLLVVMAAMPLAERLATSIKAPRAS